MSDVQNLTPPYINFMGSPSYRIQSALTRLEIMAASCFFGEPKYYGDDIETAGGHTYAVSDSREMADKLGEKIIQVPLKSSASHNLTLAIDSALDEDPEGTLQLAVRLRNLDHIRTTPQVILVRASKHPKVTGTSLVSRYAPYIAVRPDEVGVQKMYHDSTYGARRYPAALKRFWASKLESLSPYQVAKYKSTGKLVDVVNVSHPKPTEALTGLVRGSLSDLDTGETWERLISSRGSSLQTWMEAIPHMGHMALLRNIRNFRKHGVPFEAFVPRLLASAEGGRQIPFRYASAYFANKDAGPDLRRALNECMKSSLGLVPTFRGNVLALCDNSGSAHQPLSSMSGASVSTVANLSAILAAFTATGQGTVGVFGDRYRDLTVTVRDDILTTLDTVERMGDSVGQSTENGVWVALHKALEHSQHWDHIFIYSDMQCGHGGLYGTEGVPPSYRAKNGPNRNTIDVPHMINLYRQKVNPKVNVYLVQVAGYSDTIIPECYPRTFLLGGWGDGILRFADRMATIFDGSEKTQGHVV